MNIQIKALFVFETDFQVVPLIAELLGEGVVAAASELFAFEENRPRVAEDLPREVFSRLVLHFEGVFFGGAFAQILPKADFHNAHAFRVQIALLVQVVVEILLLGFGLRECLPQSQDAPARPKGQNGAQYEASVLIEIRGVGGRTGCSSSRSMSSLRRGKA